MERVDNIKRLEIADSRCGETHNFLTEHRVRVVHRNGSRGMYLLIES